MGWPFGGGAGGKPKAIMCLTGGLDVERCAARPTLGRVDGWGRAVRALLAPLGLMVVALLGAGLAVAPPMAARAAPAAGGAPDAVVRDIYKHYLETEPERLIPFDYTAPATTKAYFDPGLAKLLVAEGKRTELRLDFDPFVDGQDFEIDKVSLTITAQSAKEATVTARFLNFDEPKLITYKLVMTGEGWRIADVQWGGARATLRALLGTASR